MTTTTPTRRSLGSGTWVVAALSAAFVLTWSSGFVGGRLGTQVASTVSLLSWRFLILVPVVVGVFVLVPTVRRRLAPRHWPRAAGLGVLSQAVFLGGVIGSIEYGVSAGTSALIAALQPLVTGALAGRVLGERVSARQWIGLAVGFAGVAAVVAGDLSGGSAPAWAYLLPVVGMLGLVAATLLESRRPTPLGPVENLGVQCLASAAVLAVAALAVGDLAGPHTGEPLFWGAVAWLIVLSTIGGYGTYWATLRRTDATRVSALLYLTPPTTAVWALLMFGDAVPPLALLGFAVCGLGVVTVFRRRAAPAGR